MQTTDTAQVTVRLNGEAREVPGGLSVERLLLHLELHPKLVVVEHNGAILRRDGYDAAPVQDGDTLELVHFVGGG
ncbi:MAG TPA: sulfur carrier protein ThiS [Longimicrobiaceae bacterium]|nr:sulfur carrier protein ThiS [Longimicrobiaceae bacterium]